MLSSTIAEARSTVPLFTGVRRGKKRMKRKSRKNRKCVDEACVPFRKFKIPSEKKKMTPWCLAFCHEGKGAQLLAGIRCSENKQCLALGNTGQPLPSTGRLSLIW